MESVLVITAAGMEEPLRKFKAAVIHAIAGLKKDATGA